MEIVEPGFLTTLQDLGRPGYAHLGVSAGGAADAFSLRVGNRLVGNGHSAAALEMTLVGGRFRFEEERVFALVGGEFDAWLNDQPLAAWTAVCARAGEELRVGRARVGARLYLCVAGGFVAEEFLGSVSLDLRAGFGRPLRKGDRLRVGDSSNAPPALSAESLAHYVNGSSLRVTPGPQAHMFAPDALQRLCQGGYTVRDDSNRLGLRLSGQAIPASAKEQLLTEGVSLGAVQIPPDGQPIILFVDQQTTGGYPKLANVILADMPRVGQLAPRSPVRFAEVDLAAAHTALREREAALSALLGARL